MGCLRWEDRPLCPLCGRRCGGLQTPGVLGLRGGDFWTCRMLGFRCGNFPTPPLLGYRLWLFGDLVIFVIVVIFVKEENSAGGICSVIDVIFVGFCYFCDCFGLVVR